MDEASKQYTTFTVGNLGFFKCNHMPFGTLQCAYDILEADAELPGQAKPHLLSDLPRQT